MTDTAAQNPVHPRAIEAELARLWNEPTGDTLARTRACMSNLLIFCDDKSQTSAVTNDVAQIVQHHPSRVLLLVVDDDSADTDLEAFVAAQCHRAGDGTQICSEHVTIASGGTGLRRMPSLARALLIGDLPTALWWASPQAPQPSSGGLFSELAVMSQQVIFDSTSWPNPARDIVAVADWVGQRDGGPLAADLAWQRLLPWRRLVAQVLDPSTAPGAQAGIVEIVVDHRPAAVAQAWLLVGWLAERLRWHPTGAQRRGAASIWTFRAGERLINTTLRPVESVHDLSRVVITWSTGNGSATASLQATAAGHVEVSLHGIDTAPQVLPAAAADRAELIAKQMPDLRRDGLFIDALQIVRGLTRMLG